MTVATKTQPNYTTQSASAYKAAIDGITSVHDRTGGAFAAHEQSTPNMTVRVDAGALFAGITLTEVAAQSTGTITAPGSNSRIDRVVIDAVTGAVSVITGVSGVSPSAPAITSGKLPVAQVLLTSSSTAITNSMITDERAMMPSQATAVCAAVRQTISGGPTDSNGLPNLSGSTGSTTVTTSNISSTAPLAVAAAYGFDSASGKALDYFGFSTSNLSWTGLSTNGTMYLYVDVNTTTGALTTGSTTLAPTYQWGGTYSITNNQHTYNIQEGVMKVGNGSTAAAVARVFVGQVTVSGGVVTAITWYAYNGRYRGSNTSFPAAATAYSNNHNIGVIPGVGEQRLICTTAEAGYSVGDEVVTWANNGSNVGAASISLTSLVIAGVTGNVNTRVAHKTTGNDTAITAANWSYRLSASRGW